MFIKKFAEVDFENLFEINLKSLENKENHSKSNYLEYAINFLKISADLLDELGKEEEAEELTLILDELAEEEPEKSEKSEKSENSEESDHESEEGPEQELVDSLGRHIHDPALEGTDSPKKMLSHMKNKGWMFGNHQPAAGMLIIHEDQEPLHSSTKKSSDCEVCGQCANCCECSNCNYCGDKMTDDALFCGDQCADMAEDEGLVYDCMHDDDGELDEEDESEEDEEDESEEDEEDESEEDEEDESEEDEDMEEASEEDESEEEDELTEEEEDFNKEANDFYDLGAMMAEEHAEMDMVDALEAVRSVEEDLPLDETEEFTLGYLEACDCSLEEALKQFEEVQEYLRDNDYEPRYTLEEVEELLADDELADDPSDDLDNELEGIVSKQMMHDDVEEDEDVIDADEADVNDARSKKQCKGWKKSPVGSPRQRAFCKRHCGMKKKLTSKKVADDPDSCINQGLRRWKCRCS